MQSSLCTADGRNLLFLYSKVREWRWAEARDVPSAVRAASTLSAALRGGTSGRRRLNVGAVLDVLGGPFGRPVAAHLDHREIGVRTPHPPQRAYVALIRTLYSHSSIRLRASRVCTEYVKLQLRMGRLLQIRDVPEGVHRTLKARAAASGMSLTEYVRSILSKSASRPSPDELNNRIVARGKVRLPEPSESVVRDLRDYGE
ncbi:hypothetical protein BH18ACT6_BH18ACT6_17010 [soil metagenome]